MQSAAVYGEIVGNTTLARLGGIGGDRLWCSLLLAVYGEIVGNTTLVTRRHWNDIVCC